jgi:hypothetical protein
MNYVDFGNIVFTLNMRIRMIRDTLRLSLSPEFFLEKSVDDLVFIDGVLKILCQTLAESNGQYGGNGEFEYASDAEWQFSQLLTEFLLESSPFSSSIVPETRKKIAALRDNSDTRRRTVEGHSFLEEIAQTVPVVSSAELSGLLKGV